MSDSVLEHLGMSGFPNAETLTNHNAKEIAQQQQQPQNTPLPIPVNIPPILQQQQSVNPIAHAHICSSCIQMQHQIQQLKSENRKLRSKNETLQQQLDIILQSTSKQPRKQRRSLANDLSNDFIADMDSDLEHSEYGGKRRRKKKKGDTAADADDDDGEYRGSDASADDSDDDSISSAEDIADDDLLSDSAADSEDQSRKKLKKNNSAAVATARSNPSQFFIGWARKIEGKTTRTKFVREGDRPLSQVSADVIVEDTITPQVFHVLFDKKGTLIQPTPTNKPKSVVHVIRFENWNQVAELFGAENIEKGGYKVDVYQRAGRVSKSQKLATDLTCHIESLEVQYNRTKCKLELKFKMNVSSDSTGLYQQPYDTPSTSTSTPTALTPANPNLFSPINPMVMHSIPTTPSTATTAASAAATTPIGGSHTSIAKQSQPSPMMLMSTPKLPIAPLSSSAYATNRTPPLLPSSSSMFPLSPAVRASTAVPTTPASLQQFYASFNSDYYQQLLAFYGQQSSTGGAAHSSAAAAEQSQAENYNSPTK